MAGEAFCAVFLCVIDLKVIDAAVGERCGREVQYWAQAGGCEVVAIIMPSESYMLANVDGNRATRTGRYPAWPRTAARRQLVASAPWQLQPLRRAAPLSVKNQLLVA